MSDQDRISPYNLNTISIRQVVRIFVLDIFSIGQTKKFTTICIPTDWNFPIFENSNYKYEDELAFFIQLLNKTTFQEIAARKTVTIENPLLDSPTEEEVANDVIRVDVRHS